MTKKTQVLVSLATATLLLAGCGSGSSTPSEAASNIQQNETQTSAVDAMTPEEAKRSAAATLASARGMTYVAKTVGETDARQAAKRFKIGTVSGQVSEADMTALVTQMESNDVEAFMRNLLEEIRTENPDITDEDINDYMASVDLNKEFLRLYGNNASATESRGLKDVFKKIGDKVGDKIKDALVDIADTSVGNKLTGSTFDVVLDSEEATIFMLDQARNSETMTQIMIDALGNNWGLTKKMCPMLQTNKEFGEKFAALAEERDILGRFFFEMIDAPMYNCLADAMLLSNDDNNHHADVSHSTTAYMGILMDRYAKEYFVAPHSTPANTSGYGRKDAFVNLMFDTGIVVKSGETANDYYAHGDGNELTNEKFFYALFKTPDVTESFIGAMDQLDVPTRTMMMDHIFLGVRDVNGTTIEDPIQGYMNIIAIVSSMYDGIFGTATSKAHGFGAYTDSFIGFAKLIPSDRFFAYGTAFIGAGYEYAWMNNIDAWNEFSQGAKDIWNQYVSDPIAPPVQPGAMRRSAGLGVIGSDWFDDVVDLFAQAWSNVSLGDVFDAFMDENASVLDELMDQGNIAFDTVVDGRDENGLKVYPTEITNPIFTSNDTVYGFHGLIELAIREDMVNTGSVPDMTAAEGNFTLPPFADLTWSFVYGSATDGIVGFWNNVVGADWLADLSDNEMIRNYFYPSADNVYIPDFLLAIDWLKLPQNYTNTHFADTDFDFDAGYVDLYVVSTNPDLPASLDLPQAVDAIHTITMEPVELTDAILVEIDGDISEPLYAYKVRLVSPEDVAAVVDYLGSLGDAALNAVGIDTSAAAPARTASE